MSGAGAWLRKGQGCWETDGIQEDPKGMMRLTDEATSDEKKHASIGEKSYSWLTSILGARRLASSELGPCNMSFLMED
jgi:hypothetical protein